MWISTWCWVGTVSDVSVIDTGSQCFHTHSHSKAVQVPLCTYEINACMRQDLWIIVPTRHMYLHNIIEIRTGAFSKVISECKGILEIVY